MATFWYSVAVPSVDKSANADEESEIPPMWDSCKELFEKLVVPCTIISLVVCCFLLFLCYGEDPDFAEDPFLLLFASIVGGCMLGFLVGVVLTGILAAFLAFADLFPRELLLLLLFFAITLIVLNSSHIEAAFSGESEESDFSLNSFSGSILGASLLGLAMVAFMRFRMRNSDGTDSRLVRIYKTWHYPVFLVGNLLKREFAVISLAILFCLAMLAVFVVVAFVVGAFLFGVPGGLIGACIGLFVGGLLSEKILENCADRHFLEDLRHDMLSGDGDLRTIDDEFIFPLLCSIQTVVAFGIAGTVVGNFSQSKTINPIALASVSAFLGFFIAQLLAHAKSQTENRFFRISSSIVQGVAIGVLLLPAKRALADHALMASMLDHVAHFFGTSRSGLDSIFVLAAGCAASAFGAFSNSHTS